MKIPFYAKDAKTRTARPDDIEAAGRIGTKAFNVNLIDAYTPENTLVVENPAGAVAAVMVMTPDPMWWGTSSLPAAAVGAVATEPSEQRKGYAGAMMVGAIHHYREQGWLVSPLWPFSFAYYRKFGWELPTRDLNIHVWPDMVRTLGPASSTVRPATANDLQGIMAAYTRAAHRTNSQTNRSRTNWDTKVTLETKEGTEYISNCLVHTDADGRLDGYLLYRTQHPHRAQGLELTVREMAGDNVLIQRTLLRACADIPEVTSIHALLPADSPLPDLFPDYIGIESVQRLMVRVLDVPKALGALSPPSEAQGVVSYNVFDWVINEEKPISVTVDFGQGQMEVSPASRPDAIQCNIAAFSRLFSGGMNTQQGRMLGWLEGGSPAADAASDALLFGRTPFRSELEPG